MMQAAPCPFVSDLRPLEPSRQIIRRQPNAKLLGQPVGHLGGGPGARFFAHLLTDALFHLGSEGGVLAEMGSIWERVEPAGQEGLDPMSDALLADAQVDSDPGDAKAGIGEANHLQTIAGPGHQTRDAGPVAQFFPLRFGQVHTIHGGGFLLPPISGNSLGRPV